MITRLFKKETGSKIKETVLQGLRIGVYPYGKRRVQGAYFWSQGNVGGIEWEELPTVQVNERGQEVPR